MSITVYGFWRSIASFRVRVALRLKGLAFEEIPIDILSGEQFTPGYDAVNAERVVPTFIHNGQSFFQSLAIIEYLDERYPEPPLLPKAPEMRARVRAIAMAIACDIHPLDNLRVLRYLTRTIGASDEAKDGWYRHWIDLGLAALEIQLAGETATGEFCHGAAPSLADICLVPQLANARRSGIPLDAYPTLTRIEAACNALPAFAAAAPDMQPDAQ